MYDKAQRIKAMRPIMFMILFMNFNLPLLPSFSSTSENIGTSVVFKPLPSAPIKKITAVVAAVYISVSRLAPYFDAIIVSLKKPMILLISVKTDIIASDFITVFLFDIYKPLLF